jgi:hypothetical protein
MERRNALAMAAAATLSLTALGGAIGATTHFFQPADASNLGKVSPVSTPTLPPVVEEHDVDVIDPVAAPAPAPAATQSTRAEADEHDAPAASAPSAPAPTTAPSHESGEHEHGELGPDD